MSFLRNLVFGILLMNSFACSGQKDYLIKIETEKGEIVAVLFEDTPAHKSNFIELAEEGRFDSTQFHRVMKAFMVQGGDVFTKEKLAPTDWPTLLAEINAKHFHRKGMIAAARQGNGINPGRRSNGSQFYIVIGKVYKEEELKADMEKLQPAFMQYVQLASQEELRKEYSRLYAAEQFDSLTMLVMSKREEIEKSLNLNLTKNYSKEQIEAYTTVGGTPHLDQEYTVFGEVISGLEVAEEISKVKTGSRDVPIDPIYMNVKVEKMTRKKIEKEYGYHYPDGK
ncbi:MAG: peptidylprolyl isomerase [Algoriphagus sp.]|uniref:peptidylprolyl isomerase n=1 Tax=Algoriphagus sp. TaxID=1872435 RepID=UPI0026213F5D|nr:peptidylprolyl isomerase [Algoriphagus sp.]MDG1276892.1 peptidylprolyl isomerase [Algoriphagus sp.]